MNLTAGMRLGGRYELVRQLGEGGMGVVWLAKHADLGTLVAVKALRPEVMSDKEAVTRFDRESRAAASLRGPNVARILDVGRCDDGTPFMVMEYLEGNDLGDEVIRSGPLPLSSAVDFLLQACDAMMEAHERGIIHRDLKPENLFLARIGEHRVVKILDFGISRMDAGGEMRVTQTQSSFGTPLYMSPEQVRSTKNVDHRTDIWSLGVIFYEIVTGVPPFVGETPTAVAVAITIDAYMPIRERRPDLPPEIDDIVAKALEKDPARRFQSVRDLAAALAPFGTERGGATFPPPPPGARPQIPSANSKTLRVSNAELPARAKRPAPAWIIAAVAALTLGLLLAAAFAFRKQTATTADAPSSAPKQPDARAPATGEPATTSAAIAPDRPTPAASASEHATVPEILPAPSASAAKPATSASAKPVAKETAAPVVAPPPVTPPPPPPPVALPPPPPPRDPNPHHL